MSVIPHLYDMERPFRLMEREFFNHPDFFSQTMLPRNFDNFAPTLFKPWEDIFRSWEPMMKPIEHLSSAMNSLTMNEVGNITSDTEKFQINIDVQHFTPEEVSVKVVDSDVVVEGKHEEKQDQHGYISRQFVRRYSLPQGCLPDTVQSKLSSDGVLTVTAPKILPLPSIGERIIPITCTGPVQKRLGSQI